jgi:hypothetical protein
MAIAVVLLALTAYKTAVAQEYATYVNEKYGYEVKYPKDVFTQLEGAESKSGAVFMSEEKDADMRVNANKDLFDTGLKYEYEDMLGTDVLEKNYNGEAGWFTVMSLKGQTIVYTKKILKDGVYYTLEIEYPDFTHAEIEPMVKEISDSFRVLPKSGN